MAREWQRVVLADVIDIISGGTPKTTVAEYWGGDIPWLSVADFNTGYRWVSAAEKTITCRGLRESATTVLNEHDIIISARGTVGVVAQLAKPMAFNQSCYGVRGKPQIAEVDFIYYTLRHAVAEMKQIAHGGVFDTITRDTFKLINIALPPVPEQCAIAHILGTLDRKIELNRRMNETLEAIARSIFKSWFVDFDPVRVKAEGRDPGLPKQITDHFPDSFEDSELGEIPKGWEVGCFGDVAVNPRRSLQPHKIDPSTPYIALEHMPKRCIAIASWEAADGLESNKLEFRRGEILFGKLRPYFHKVVVAPLDGVCSTDIVVIAPKTERWFGFVLGHSSSAEFVEYTNAGSIGTKMPRTSWTEMARYTIIIPPGAIADAFNKMIRPAVERIITSIHESGILAALRDALLPKLISGQMRMKDAEKFVERSA
jgi:type I restriction enzyme S subunit